MAEWFRMEEAVVGAGLKMISGAESYLCLVHAITGDSTNSFSIHLLFLFISISS